MIREIETALNIEDQFAPVKLHFAAALKGITNSSPDFRNSIKESISAVISY